MSLEDYPHPALTADVVLFTLHGCDLWVLLIQRKEPPFEGRWAFPGGFVDLGESPKAAALRELMEETGLRDVQLDQLHTFGDPGRDPRGHVVTVAYVGFASPGAIPQTRAGDDAADARWWPVRDLPPLAFDHEEILSHALDRLRSKLACTPDVNWPQTGE